MLTATDLLSDLLPYSTAVRQLDFKKSILHPIDSSTNERLQRKYKKFRELASSPCGSTSSLESPLEHGPAPPAQEEQTLTQTSVASPHVDLPLPAGYKLIKEMFQSTDIVVSMMQGRGEICTYSKLKQAVERMTRR